MYKNPKVIIVTTKSNVNDLSNISKRLNINSGIIKTIKKMTILSK